MLFSMKAIVLGMGVSGRGAARFLRGRGAEVVCLDRKGGEGILSDRGPIPWDGVEQLVLSPGIAPHHPVVREAEARGVEVVGEVELAFRFLRNRCVGITGTNGKTTVTLLVAHVLNAVGMKAEPVGNVGTSLLDAGEGILAIELSSYQLETVRTRRLEAAVILNVTPDHLDRYGSMEAYRAAKARIGEVLLPGGTLWVSRDSGIAGRCFEGNVETISRLDYTIRGRPERQNLEAAYALVAGFGVTVEAFLAAVETFRKPAHRIEWVRTWRGISFYDDSKGTNIDAVRHAVALFDKPIHLLAGGVHKGASYRPWLEALRGKVVRIVAYGEAAELMERELGSEIPVVRRDKFADAFCEIAAGAQEGEIVLLSPGCSSFDQFTDYAHRGAIFQELVHAL